MDWLDQTRQGRLRAYMVPPTNLNDEYGELEGIDWSSSSITAQYYSDTRTSAQLVVHGDKWIRGSFIRIVYEIPEWDYKAELGTYAVINDNAERKNGEWITTLELHSMLYTMSLDLAARPMVIAPGAYATTAIRKELNEAGRPHLLVSPNEYRTTGALVMESGKSHLSRVFELCSMSGNRLDVDGHGRVIVSRYIEPSAKPASYVLDLTDARGIVEDGISRSTNWLELPTEVVVEYKKDEPNDAIGDSEYIDEHVIKSDNNNDTGAIVGIATVSGTDHAAKTVRGYKITKFYSVSDMTPATALRAQQLARQYLSEASLEKVEWTIKAKYLPIWEGDVISLVIPDGEEQYRGVRKCLVKSVDFSPPYMDMSITLKETASGDTEEAY